ncbi:MAG: SDR family NAD(P)-dependent oxidoreductase [Isosphaeraceae bacterium]
MPLPVRGAIDRSNPPVLLLTGAANGIGRATARALATQGFRLGLMDRDAEPLIALERELQAAGAAVSARAVDVRDAEAVQRAVDELEAELGPTDILLACAGVGVISSSTQLELGALRTMLEVNVLGVAHTIGAVVPRMFARKSGHIVGISSVAGYRGMPWMPGYSASKSALSTYLEGLRPGFKRRGVRITTVYPGFVRTALTQDTPFTQPVPMLEPEQAAHYLVRAVLRRPRDYVFPLSARFGMGFLRVLPCWFYDRLMDYTGPRALTSEF